MAKSYGGPLAADLAIHAICPLMVSQKAHCCCMLKDHLRKWPGAPKHCTGAGKVASGVVCVWFGESKMASILKVGGVNLSDIRTWQILTQIFQPNSPPNSPLTYAT